MSLTSNSISRGMSSFPHFAFVVVSGGYTESGLLLALPYTCGFQARPVWETSDAGELNGSFGVGGCSVTGDLVGGRSVKIGCLFLSSFLLNRIRLFAFSSCSVVGRSVGRSGWVFGALLDFIVSEY